MLPPVFVFITVLTFAGYIFISSLYQFLGPRFKIRKRARVWTRNSSIYISNTFNNTINRLQSTLQGKAQNRKNDSRFGNYSRNYHTGRGKIGRKLPEYKFITFKIIATLLEQYRHDFDNSFELSPKGEDDLPNDQDIKRKKTIYHYIACPTTLKGIHKETFDTDSFEIGIDTLASKCMSPVLEDFVPGSLMDCTKSKKQGVQPFGKGPKLRVMKRGTLVWKVEDDDGNTHVFYIPGSLYVPDGRTRLLSPQHWARALVLCGDDKNTTCARQFYNRNVMTWGDRGQFHKTVYCSSRSNVPMMSSAGGYTQYEAHISEFYEDMDEDLSCLECCQAVASPAYISDEESVENEAVLEQPRSIEGEENLVDLLTPENDEDTQPIHVEPIDDEELMSATTIKGELLRWHYRLGHLSFNKLQALAKLRVLPYKLSSIRPPKCACCMYGAMTKKPWRSKGSANKRSVNVATKSGECVSVDQMESSSFGFVAQLKGKLTKRKYKYATVFVDHYSRYTYVYLQERLTSEETVAAKGAFEAHARSMNVTIQHYHADNGRFADNGFIKHARLQGQPISYCGVNAHWQNGIAEKRIRDLRESARKQLFHAISKWPGAIITQLWPYALRNAAHVANNMPTRHGSSPIELFASTEVRGNLKNMHTFGCPVFALDSRLQASKPVSSWNHRSRLGINLGPSPRHARSVSLILNLDTGMVSPQYHITHDEFFETINIEDKSNIANWIKLTGFKSKKVIIDRSSQIQHMRDKETNAQSISNTLLVDAGDGLLDQMNGEDQGLEEDNEELEQTANDQQGNISGTRGSIIMDGIRRSARLMMQSQETEQEEADSEHEGDIAMQGTEEDDPYYDALHEEDYKLQDNMIDPIAFKASGDPDTMYYQQAISQPDRLEFIKAIVKEVNDHTENGHWKLIPTSEVPKGTKVIDSVWSMKRKRDIRTREIKRYKARLNIHGGQQEYGVHFTDTYSPVVNWSSVRTILLHAILKKWKMRQIDFVLAYPQAPIPFDNYMRLPKGIRTKGGSRDTHVLKLVKNIYGGRNSGLVWNQYLNKGLVNIGFQKSAVDECVYYRGSTIFLNYVDDGILIDPDDSKIDNVIRELQDIKLAGEKYKIDDQGDIKDYLGINFEYNDDGSVLLSQPHLIQQIVEDVKILERAIKPTPALSSRLLRRCKQDPPGKADFEYRSVIGKLNYLEKSSRPDIAYAVHQCARFCSDPKEAHIQAVIHLAKYLNATKDKGIVMRPDYSKSFEVYADADFAGNWFKSTAMEDPSTAKSRSGYVIMYLGCPVYWGSKLQTQVALSTCEAEYISLSQALRDAIPIMELMKEMENKGISDKYETPVIHCKAFEDNSGALEIAKLPKMRPRTKHINNIYHHFRSYVKEGHITVHPITSKNQIADLFTKPLAQNLFVPLRIKLMGW